MLSLSLSSYYTPVSSKDTDTASEASQLHNSDAYSTMFIYALDPSRADTFCATSSAG